MVHGASRVMRRQLGERSQASSTTTASSVYVGNVRVSWTYSSIPLASCPVQPILRAQAESAAADASVPVEVRAGRAEELPVADSSTDGMVASLMPCTVTAHRATARGADG